MTGVLYHSPSEIIAQMLDDLGLADLQSTGTGDPLTGWTVFPIHLPEDPEQALVVKDTSGRIHGRMQPTGVIGEHYGIQILARSSVDPVTPYKRVKLILEAFDTLVNREEVTLIDDNSVSRTYRVNAVTRVGPAVPAGNDGQRFFYSGNAVASIELVETEDEGSETGTGS